MRRNGPIFALLLAYLLVGTLYAVFTPDWQAPDEPAHYNYIRQLANGVFPVIELGDYNQDYQTEAITNQFAPGYDVGVFSYEDHQPPLYYLLQTPVFLLSGGSLRALRLMSVLIGSGIVALAYAVARSLFPSMPWLSLTIAGFVAFLPQHVAILASVNNDSLAELLIAAMLWLLVRNRAWWDRESSWRPAGRRATVLGVLLGLAFLTKATTYILAPVAGLLLLWRLRGYWSELWRAGLQLALPALLLGSLWWGRNIIVYDALDPLASAAHNAVVVGQPRTSDWIAQFGLDDTLASLTRTTFRSFWGQFGWMGVPMPALVYECLLLLTVIAGSGWLLRRRLAPHLALPSSVTYLLLLVIGLNLALYLGYNLTFVQHQGRYLFPSLVPVAVLFAVGLSSWAAPVVRRLPASAWALPMLLSGALFGLSILALFWFIVPALSP